MWNKERNEMILKLMEKANALVKNYTWDAYDELWTMCNDWNRDHEDAEIFMCETCDDDELVNGFMIEDDTWYYERG